MNERTQAMITTTRDKQTLCTRNESLPPSIKSLLEKNECVSD